MVRSTRENGQNLYFLLKKLPKLEKLEKVVEHQGQKSTNDSLSGHKSEKKLYGEQHDFSLKVLRHLQNVALFDSSVPVGRDKIEAGMSLRERDKFLVLADSFGWDVVLCDAKEPLAEDREDERKIHRVKKEGKIRRDEHLNQNSNPDRNIHPL